MVTLRFPNVHACIIHTYFIHGSVHVRISWTLHLIKIDCFTSIFLLILLLFIDSNWLVWRVTGTYFRFHFLHVFITYMHTNTLARAHAHAHTSNVLYFMGVCIYSRYAMERYKQALEIFLKIDKTAPNGDHEVCYYIGMSRWLFSVQSVEPFENYNRKSSLFAFGANNETFMTPGELLYRKCNRLQTPVTDNIKVK